LLQPLQALLHLLHRVQDIRHGLKVPWARHHMVNEKQTCLTPHSNCLCEQKSSLR
jgi:DTW domain-containing protein YfiP